MALDVQRIIGAVTREIASEERDGKPTRVLIASRSYHTNMDDLWDALTNPERIPRWFLPVSGELRLGGRYQFEGNAGGEIAECEPPSRLALTWEMHGQVSWVTVQLSAKQKDVTELRLRHEAVVPDDLWEQFGPGGVGVGWDSGMLGLDRYLAKDEAISPATGMAWIASAEGRQFVRESSEAWANASIASGTSVEAAWAAAAQTTAAYTGEVVGQPES